MQLLYLVNRIEGRAAAGQATATPKVKYPKLATSAKRKSLALILCRVVKRWQRQPITLLKESVVTITW